MANTTDALIDPEATSAVADIYGQNGPQAPGFAPPDFLTGALNALSAFGQAGTARSNLGPQSQQPNYGSIGDAIDQTPVLGGIKSLAVTPFSDLTAGAIPRGQYAPNPEQVANEAFGMTIGAPEAKLAEGAIGALTQQATLRAGALPGKALAGLERSVSDSTGSPVGAGFGQARVPQAVTAGREVSAAEQIASLRASGASEQEIADFARTMGSSLSSEELRQLGPAGADEVARRTVEKASAGRTVSEVGGTDPGLDPGLLTREIQAAAGTPEIPLSQHPLLSDYALGGSRASGVNAANHGGDIGTATRAVMSGDSDVQALFGDELTNKLIRNKAADILRRTGLTQDVVDRAMFIETAEGRGGAIDSLSARQLAATADRFPQVPPSMVDANVTVVSDALREPQPMDSLIASMRASGASEADILSGLRTLGLGAKEAKAWLGTAATDAAKVVEGARPVPSAALGEAEQMPLAAQPPSPPGPPGPTASGMSPADWGGNIARALGDGALAIFTDIPRAISLVGHLPLFRQAAPLIADSILRGDPLEVAQALWRTGTGLLTEGNFQAFRRGAITNLERSSGVKGVWNGLILDTHGALNQTEEFALRSIFATNRVVGSAVGGVIGGTQGNTPEEHLQNALKGAAAGAFVPNLNRMYPSMLNSLRYGAAQAMIDMHGGVGVSAEEAKRIIAAVNLMSGRGAMFSGPPGSFGANAAKTMNGIFFGPKYLTSEFQTIPSVAGSSFGIAKDAIMSLAAGVTRNPALARPLDPVEVFKVRAFAGYVGSGMAIMNIMNRFGWNLDLDPRSRDFGTGIAPDGSRVDPWGGLGSVARLAVRESYFLADALAGRKPRYGAESGRDMAISFFQGKLNPGIATAAANTLSGQLPNGDPLPDIRGAISSGDAGAALGGAYRTAFGSQGIQPIALEAATGSPPNSPTVGGEKPQPQTHFDLAKFLLAESGMGIKSTQMRPNYDGLGAGPDDPTYGTGEILGAFGKLQSDSKGTWHKDEQSMAAPVTTIGTGERKIQLDQWSAQRWVTALGQEREIQLRQMMASPAWSALPQKQKEALWDQTVQKADKVAGSKFLAHDLLQQTDPKLQTAEALDGFIKQGSSTKDKAYWVAALDRAGKLTPEISAAIDALKDTPPNGKAPLTTAEYLKAAPMVHEYLSHVPYGTDAHPYGTPQDWTAAEIAKVRVSVRANALERGGTLKALAEQQAKLEVYRTLAGHPQQQAILLQGAALENPARKILALKNPTLSTFLGPLPSTYQEPIPAYQSFPFSR